MDKYGKHIDLKGYIIIIIFIVLIVTIAVCFFIPMQSGSKGIIQNIIKYGALSLLCGISNCLIIYSKKTNKETLYAIIILTVILIIASFLSLKLVKSLGAEQKTFVSSDYKVKHNYSVYSSDTYILTVVLSNGEGEVIYVTKSIYNNIKDSDRPIKVVFHPYANIASSVEFVE